MKNIRPLTEGAIFAALFSLIAYLSVIFPILMSLFIWILPVPIIVYTVRHGWKNGIITWIVATLVSFFIGGPTLLVVSFIFGNGGIITGELFRRKKEAYVVLLGGSLAYIINLLLNFIISITVFDLHPIKVVQQIMTESIHSAEQMLKTLGQENTDQLLLLTDFVDQLIIMTPALLITTGTFYALFVQLIATAVLKRIGEKFSIIKPLREWSFPKSFLWYYLIISLLSFMKLGDATALYLVVSNLFPILEIIMAIQGLAVFFYYCHIKKINRTVPVVVMILSIFMPFFLYMFRILGIIDLGFELRKKMNNSK